MTLFAVLDATHYPIAVFRDHDNAQAFVASHVNSAALYIVRTHLAD